MKSCYYGSDGYCSKVWQGIYPAQACGTITTTTECAEIWIDYFVPGICEKLSKDCTDNLKYPSAATYDYKNS